MNDLQKEVLRRTFENRRQQILNVLNHTEQLDRTQSHNSNPGFSITNSEVSTQRRIELSGFVRDLDDALARVNDNTIGFCVDCGDEISIDRLLACPAIQHCLCCQVDMENIRTPYTLWKYTA